MIIRDYLNYNSIINKGNIVISPAKKLNTTLSNDVLPSKPQSKHAIEFSVANKLSITELKKLMGLSDSLAELNSERFASFGQQKTFPAAFIFIRDLMQLH